MLCEPGTAQEDQTLDIVDEVGQADLDRRAIDADGSGEQVHAIFLFGEDVFDTRRGPSIWRYCAARGFRRRFALGFLALSFEAARIPSELVPAAEGKTNPLSSRKSSRGPRPPRTTQAIQAHRPALRDPLWEVRLIASATMVGLQS